MASMTQVGGWLFAIAMLSLPIDLLARQPLNGQTSIGNAAAFASSALRSES